MKKEYAIYPFRNMNITQRHDQGNHEEHWKDVTNHSDKPWDEACKDTGRCYFEPQNDFLIQEVKGINTTKTTNAVRLKSVNKLYIPYKKEPDYLYVTLTHMNESNLKQVKQGQILKKGTKILMEGTDGNATGNHFHMTANIGKYHGLLENNNGKWCWTYDKSLLPNEAFYLDKSYTTIKNARSYVFKEVPKEENIKTIGSPVARDTTKDQIEVMVDQLRVRSNGNTNSTILGYVKKGIYNYTETKKANNYTWYNIGIGWIAYTNKWCKLYSKEVVVEVPKVEQEIPKKEENQPVKEENPPKEVQNVPNNEKNDVEEVTTILQRIIEFIKKIISLITK